MLRPAKFGASAEQCYVLRVRGGMFGSTIWRLYSERDDRFLAAAVKRSGKGSANWLIAAEETPGDRASTRVLGKLRADWAGELFVCYDHGMAPVDAEAESSIRRELACVGFDWDKMGPGKMVVALPLVSEAGRPQVVRPRHEEDSLAFLAADDPPRAHLLQNKRPRWDPAVNGHVLNFRGRVTKSSVKNFQLGGEGFGDATILQFGRIGKDRFTMDFQWPLSALQAFAIVVASLDTKLADSKAWGTLFGPKHGKPKPFSEEAKKAAAAKDADTESIDPKMWFRDWKERFQKLTKL